MTAAAFDTLTTARELEAAGVERRQAEAIAGAVRQAVSADRGELATKADLDTAIADLKTDMLKVAIGVAIGVVIANATLTAVFVFGALRLLQP